MRRLTVELRMASSYKVIEEPVTKSSSAERLRKGLAAGGGGANALAPVLLAYEHSASLSGHCGHVVIW